MEFHRSERLSAAGLPFSESVRVGDVLYLSGQLGNLPGRKELVPGGIEAEAHQTMRNIEYVLKKHGLALGDVFKCTVMLADMAEWEAFNKIYATYFKPDRLPARSAFGTTGLALGARVEVECWAHFAKPQA
ncbi:MAG: RidA family protein [Alphaproteobacteria bacterium]|nr:RidA family protein [Alphaproteobacteria bacterium]